MTRRGRSGILLAACMGLAMAIGQPAQAGGAHGGGGGGGIRGGHAGKGGWGRGWAGHRFVFANRWGRGRFGWNGRNGWNGRFGRNGWGWGNGGGWGWSYGGSLPYAAGYGPAYGYGGGGPDFDDRSPSHPPVGILPSPVLPPAIYVIGGKSGRAAPAVIRKSRAGGPRSAGIRAAEGGASAAVRGGTDRRYRTN